MANICLIDDEKALNQVLKFIWNVMDTQLFRIIAYRTSIKELTGTRCMIFILLILCFQMAVAPNC